MSLRRFLSGLLGGVLIPAFTTLVLALGGCAGVSLAGLAAGSAIEGAQVLSGAVDRGAVEATTPRPSEPRTGSTGGSWTGVCDPVCPKVPGGRP